MNYLNFFKNSFISVDVEGILYKRHHLRTALSVTLYTFATCTKE